MTIPAQRVITGDMAELILTDEEVGDSIMIGKDIEIVILEKHGNQVRIGINAPRHISVHRDEVYQKIQHKRAATNRKKP